MPKEDLTALVVSRLVKQRKVGRHRVSKRLYLQVRPSGSASWLFRYMHHSRVSNSRNDKPRREGAHWMGLGEYPVVDLAAARAKALQRAGQLDQDIDPLADKRAGKAKTIATANTITFGKCARDYIAEHESSWKSEKHAAQWHVTFEGSNRKPAATAAINNLPVSRIDTALAKEVLAPIWHKTPETATRVRNRCEAVIDFAKVRGYRDPDNVDNPFRWKGHLKLLLADPARLKERKGKRHLPALPYGDIAAFMAELRSNASVSARALEFTILTAGRTSEVVKATWREIDRDAKTWTVPVKRMKTGSREHRVPLSQRALDILAALPREDDNLHLFVGAERGAPLSNTAMLELMHDMRPGFVVHGVRSTFRDWAAECTNFPREVCELALAHSNKNKSEAAYQRGDLFAKRRELMNEWAQYCATPPATTDATVTCLRVRGEAS